jgi:glycosyltransferase involved in cell wall biosynthesis
MGKRQSIGLIFSYDENWIGGSYYIINIIKTLSVLEESKKPFLQILSYTESDFVKIKELNYPYIEYIIINVNLPLWKRVFNKISQLLFKKHFFNRSYKHLDEVEILFPALIEEKFNSIKHKIFWIPDFQERYLSHFFKEEEIEPRLNWQTAISKEKEIIFSSNSAMKDFNVFYPNSTINKYVFNFSSILPQFDTVNIDAILKKYNLTNDVFFFSPNQFWEHKNHIIILKALKKLKEAGNLNFQVYFSGKEYDYRNPDYFERLNQFVIDNKLQDNIRFLGFIDREDQLCLMNYALAIIQPSLFEGWSTVVEDAKALNQNIIVSNLEVHKEQLGDFAFFFDPSDELTLIEQIKIVIEKGERKFNFNYSESIQKSALNFISIIESVSNQDN